MKISTLIKRLESIQKKHRDVQVGIHEQWEPLYFGYPVELVSNVSFVKYAEYDSVRSSKRHTGYNGGPESEWGPVIKLSGRRKNRS